MDSTSLKKLTPSALSVSLSLCLMLAVAVVAQTEPAAADGSPGSYAIVLDREDELLSGTYWIAENVRLVVRGRNQPASLRPVLLDREFMPGRLMDGAMLRIERYEHSAPLQISDLVLGTPTRVTTRQFTPQLQAILAMEAKPEPAPVPEDRGSDKTMQVTLVSSQILNLGGRTFRTYSIEQRSEDSATPGTDPVSRSLYLSELGMLIGQDKVGPPARLEQGRMISSVDFLAHVEMLAYKNKLPQTAACLNATRQTEPFKAAAATWRDVVDAYTARAFPVSGLSYELTKRIKEIEPLRKQVAVSEICKP